MPNLNQLLSKVRKSVTGITSSSLDQELDKAISDINQYRTFNGDRTYIDLVKSLINKLGSVSDLSTIPTSELTPASIGQQSRLSRYRLYQDITEKISYCDRALKVLTDNILAPDDISKKSLEISSSSPDESDENINSTILTLKNIIQSLKLDDNLDDIVSNTLCYGDYFVEIADIANITDMSSGVLIEQKIIDDNVNLDIEENCINLHLDLSYLGFNLRETSNGFEIINESNSILDEDYSPTIKNLFLIYHHPKYVVKLQSERFDKVCLGYLVFPKFQYYMLSQLTIGNTIDGLIAKVAQSLSTALDTKIHLKHNKDIKEIVKNILQYNESGSDLKVRFVPVERMVHFKIGSPHKFFPYGESIFNCVAFQAKLLIAQEVANVIFRLSRSTEKRIVGIEVGLPRDARELVETLKEQFRKRKINIDSFGTLDSIASNISTFEDIYLPMKDGKRFVEVEAGNFGGVDYRGRVDETKFLRDSIIAGLSVPPSFLNIEENLSNKSALTEENILFTRSVIGYQRNIIKYIRELISKCYSLTNQDYLDFDKININFPVPKSLQFEREAKYVGDAVNLIESLKGLGLPKEYLTRRYLTNIDWDDIKVWKIKNKIDDTITPPEEEEEGGGGGGGAMSSF